MCLALLRLLATLWECQGAAHGAVELLRGQPDFWKAFKVSNLMMMCVFLCIGVCFHWLYLTLLLAMLWECQGAAHSAVELLRPQTESWKAVKVLIGLDSAV